MARRDDGPGFFFKGLLARMGLRLGSRAAPLAPPQEADAPRVEPPPPAVLEDAGVSGVQPHPLPRPDPMPPPRPPPDPPPAAAVLESEPLAPPASAAAALGREARTLRPVPDRDEPRQSYASAAEALSEPE